MLEPCVLSLQLQHRVIATADFQDETPLLAVDPEIEILLAPKRLQSSAQPVMLFQQLKRLRRRHLRAGQTGAVNQRGERHTTIP